MQWHRASVLTVLTAVFLSTILWAVRWTHHVSELPNAAKNKIPDPMMKAAFFTESQSPAGPSWAERKQQLCQITAEIVQSHNSQLQQHFQQRPPTVEIFHWNNTEAVTDTMGLWVYLFVSIRIRPKHLTLTVTLQGFWICLSLHHW